MAKPSWWNPTYLSETGVVRGPVAMLLAHAMASGSIVLTGSARGVLEEDNEAGRKELLKDLLGASGGAIALSGGPILGRGKSETWIVWASGVVIVEIGLDEKVTVSVATTDEKPYVALGEVIGNHILPEHVRQPVYALTQSGGEMGISEVGTAGSLLIEGNYTPQVLEDFQFIIEDLQKKIPFGRLVIVEGKPGVGKTRFLRGIINEVLDAIFILVPSHVVESLAGPEMMPMLLKARGLAGSDKPIVLIIEDGDRCLVIRESGDDKQMAAISALLNLTDGILGQAIDLRVVVTTNASILAKDETTGLDAVDPALRRPGRLSKHTVIGSVSAKQAAKIFKRETEGEVAEFEGPHTLAQIYAEVFLYQANEDQEEEDEDEFDEDADEDEEDEEGDEDE